MSRPIESQYDQLAVKKLLIIEELVLQGVSVETAVLLASGQVVDLNGEIDALIMDAAQNVRLDGSSAGKLRVKISGGYDFEFSADTLKALAGSSILTDTIGETTTDAGVTIDGLLVIDQMLQAWKRKVIAKASNFTASVAESGCTYEIGAADLVVTLPATAPGLQWRFVLAAGGLSSSTGLQISPNASDQLIGNGFTLTDNKDAILAGSGDRAGDCIEVEGDAAGTGYFLKGIIGTWTRET